MKSANSSRNSILKSVRVYSANMVEAVSTCLCAFAAFGCLFILDGWLMKLAGFVGFFVLAYLVAWAADLVKGNSAKQDRNI
ncbi:hypothetical protein AUM84_11780 [Cronobacter sakazakii]|nr:hypothetical protein [Cronobacter sakazakii]KAB1044487.1 hypothetical protein AUM84_11780 [Cronobacter sakazakii]KAB1049455.1 hypothetical protein AUM85_19920 [Cronobacter sakazakii]HAU5508568.1 hypothetical protein [Cronobacter sakazakii]